MNSVVNQEQVENQLELYSSSLSVVSEKNLFTSPEAYYSLGQNPQTYGFSLVKHKADTSFSFFHDTYSFSLGFLSIKGAELPLTLPEAHMIHATSNNLTVIDRLTADFVDGERVDIKGEDSAKSFTVNGMQGLRCQGEFWRYTKGSNDTTKYIAHYATIQGPNNTYLVNLLYLQDESVEELFAQAFFHETLETFNALK